MNCTKVSYRVKWQNYVQIKLNDCSIPLWARDNRIASYLGLAEARNDSTEAPRRR